MAKRLAARRSAYALSVDAAVFPYDTAAGIRPVQIATCCFCIAPISISYYPTQLTAEKLAASVVRERSGALRWNVEEANARDHGHIKC